MSSVNSCPKVSRANLWRDSIVEYRKYDVQAIISRESDRGVKPPVGDKMRPDNFEDVANFVYSKADKW